jgi:FkbM family methyltransferase
MSQQTVLLKLGNWLYRHCFPLYNFAYRRFKRSHDRRELELLGERIRPGDRVLDIGSNIGFYADVLSTLVGPAGKVFCFEPERTNFRHLAQNLSSRTNTALFNLAVSDRGGSLAVYRSKLLNVDHRTYPVDEFESVETVQAISIDALIEKGTIDRVDFIKIDIQGYELTAFKGMNRLWSAERPPAILTEFWPHGMKKAGIDPRGLFEFFDRLQYRFGLVEDAGLKPIGRDYFVENAGQPFEFSPNVLIEKRPSEKDGSGR